MLRALLLVFGVACMDVGQGSEQETEAFRQ